MRVIPEMHVIYKVIYDMWLIMRVIPEMRVKVIYNTRCGSRIIYPGLGWQHACGPCPTGYKP